MMRRQGVTLLKAVEAVKSLRLRFGPPGKRWADAQIFTEYGDVFVYAADEWETTKHRQKIADQLFGKEFSRLRDRADALLIPPQFQPSVEIDPAIKNGLPIVLSTSMQTSVIHGLRQRYGYDDIRAMYPSIPRDLLVGANEYEDFLDRAMEAE
jgi:hypothetical protein